jgi:pilus biogenesis lipoprotein CpaD
MSIMIPSASGVQKLACPIAAPVRILLSLCLLLPLAGCGATERMVVSSIPQDDYKVRHPIVLGEEPRTLEILVEPATGQFDRRSAAQLREFAGLYRKFGRGPITIMPPAFPGATPPVEPVRGALYAAGAHAPTIVSPYPAGPNLAAPVRLSFLGLKARGRSMRPMAKGPCRGQRCRRGLEQQALLELWVRLPNRTCRADRRSTRSRRAASGNAGRHRDARTSHRKSSQGRGSGHELETD